MTLEELNRIVDEIITNHKEVKITPRELLEAFNAYRRTPGNIRIVDNYLKGHNVMTRPNYNSVWLDENIILQDIQVEPSPDTKRTKQNAPYNRVKRIINRCAAFRNRIERISNLNVDLSVFGRIPNVVGELPSLLVNDELTDKIKEVLVSRLSEIESSLNKIETYSKKGRINRTRISNSIRDLNESARAINFTIGTFKKLGYLDENLVAIGANGSGKTTLAENIKRYVKTNCVVIGAQKLLLLPKFNSVLDTASSQKQLSEQQAKDKALRQPLDYDRDENEHSIADDVADEFSAVINNLLAMHNEAIHKFANKYAEDNSTPREKTILEKVFDLWHQILPHRLLSCPDGINIMVHSEGEEDGYPAYQLSDGEKVTLYLIADVMQTAPNSYIVVDEPETYLHKSIVNKLWDLLENERKKDKCTFVYLTHNVDFAVSRHAKKIWIKSYNTKNALGWDIQDIPDNEIPQELLLEILGSRRPILFCEGVLDKSGTYTDAQIYEILYPQFTIKPVHSCKDVINYTKAFNAIPNIASRAYGLIDSDFRNRDTLTKLAASGIYATKVSEIENLFLCEGFLKKMAIWIHVDPEESFDKISDAIKKTFNSNIDIQVSQYVSSRIDFVFKEEHFKQANSKSDLKTHFKDFCDKILIDDWVTERENELHTISDNYDEIIKVYNNKGLKTHVNSAFSINNFSERAYLFLRESNEAKDILRGELPNELVEAS